LRTWDASLHGPGASIGRGDADARWPSHEQRPLQPKCVSETFLLVSTGISSSMGIVLQILRALCFLSVRGTAQKLEKAVWLQQSGEAWKRRRVSAASFLNVSSTVVLRVPAFASVKYAGSLISSHRHSRLKVSKTMVTVA